MNKSKVDQTINSISPSFCLAKWLQSTIDLQHGLTHSCHHNPKHQIDKDEIRINPSALHNTKEKLAHREMMLKGERPKECRYCWEIEDLEDEHVSDRYIKSNDPWAKPFLAEILADPLNSKIVPRHLEIMLDNTCNLACSYCIASVSNRIHHEMQSFGHYNVKDSGHRVDNFSTPSTEYTEAFFKWLPEIIGKLKVLRITGGEPFASKSFDAFLQTLLRCGDLSHLELHINTNLSLPSAITIEKLSKIKALQNSSGVKLEFYTSLESIGCAAEYARNGLSFDLFNKNLNYLIDHFKNEKIIIMATFNTLALEDMIGFGKYILSLKKRSHRLILDSAHLSAPEYLRLNIITPELVDRLENFYSFLVSHKSESGDGFSDYETDKFLRILSWTKIQPPHADITRTRADLVRFLKEFDRRYNLNHGQNFPSLVPFLNLCKKSILLEAMEQGAPQ